MSYAVIKTGGKQYRVQQGDQLDVEKLALDEGAETTFEALMIGEGDSVKVGSPIVEGSKVTAKVVSQFRGLNVVRDITKQKDIVVTSLRLKSPQSQDNY